MNQWWLVYQRIYASLRLNELSQMSNIYVSVINSNSAIDWPGTHKKEKTKKHHFMSSFLKHYREDLRL